MNPETINSVGTMSELEKNTHLSRKERESVQHRQDILDAGVSLFAELGYHQTTMQMVADRAEFSVGYLYKHFSGKEEMYQELVRFHLQKMDELTEGFEDLDLGPLDKLHQMYVSICQHFNRHRDFMRIFHEGVGGDFCELTESKKEHLRDMAEMLDQALADGSLKPCEPFMVAAAMQGATKELFHELAQRKTENPFDPLPEILFGLIIDPLRK